MPGEIDGDGTRPWDVGLISRVSLLEWLSWGVSTATTLLMIAAFPMDESWDCRLRLSTTELVNGIPRCHGEPIPAISLSTTAPGAK